MEGAWSFYDAGDYEKSLEQGKQALRAAKEAGNKKREAEAYTVLAKSYYRAEDYEKSIEQGKQALNATKEAGNKESEASAYQVLAWSYYMAGDYEKSIEYGKQALSSAKETGNEENEASAHDVLAKSYHGLGDHIQARFHERSLEERSGSGDFEETKEEEYAAHAGLPSSSSENVDEADTELEVAMEKMSTKQKPYWGLKFRGGSSAKPSPITTDRNTIYKMSQSTRGIAVIINNKDFLRCSGMTPRKGTDVDRNALEKLFEDLKFEVRIFNNQTKDEIKTIAKRMAETSHSSYDAFVFSILTHGRGSKIYGTDSELSIKKVTSIIKDCTTLVGKPKIFLFQACRGSRYMDGMDMVDYDPQPDSKVSVPAEADFVYAYSTVPGYYSWRNPECGSWFIESLTKVFKENAAHMDILRMLTRVNAMVSTYKTQTDDPQSNNRQQVSSVVSMLRKELYFFPENITKQN